MTVRVRFAPSPTGLLHLGGLRTALYNFLFARKHGGRFILRIEDTDTARTVPGSASLLLRMLQDAGIGPDEGYGVGGDHGPYVQSERKELYAAAAARLEQAGLAYRCSYDDAEVERYRKEEEARVGSFVFRRRAAEDLLGGAGRRGGGVIRLDAERALQQLGEAEVDDAILVKSDGLPTYHLASVVDDQNMGISHVIRGEEWLSSAPKHILLHRALGHPPPPFAHLPLLLNPDGGKLSKRHEHGTVESFVRQGFEMKAILSYTASMGFTPSKEIMTVKELIEEFDLSKVHKHGTRVDIGKFSSIQTSVLRGMCQDSEGRRGLWLELGPRLRELVKVSGQPILADRVEDDKYFEEVVKTVVERVERRSEILSQFLYFWTDPDPEALASHTAAEAREQVIAHLENFEQELQKQAERREGGGLDVLIEEARKAAKAAGAKAMSKGAMMKFVRLALTGKDGGPSLTDIFALLGPPVSLRRVSSSLKFLRAPAAPSS
ncbi:hypothetical protein GUITHDRAFT_113021 [Guillardia theta CCMP2712]|uniref:glutamate--tRNA ligase n=1 Tax=Guillardia theta (strain CCMP2712) TaxID=905079 RepID=L1IYN4_GUITC|nr:hypothetical protein GUITHDRAFT_113021 [Guillardia theta CCMP2712]EKX41014.1 hypothetical protein GUITHDRAFT_113021 [Guillardia theta CCMP2712]|eukprot:XP_005827994.1 hypothetical protein GUITHDRAFT_113021 [Guillardia theta CCMP2712]